MPRMELRHIISSCVAAALLSTVALATINPNNDPRVVVPDAGNNRVLIYFHPLQSGQRADVVLGQSSFSTRDSGLSDTAMATPVAYAFDKNGNLYIADNGNCRVLQFRPPFTSGQAASAVIGKPDFNTGCLATTSATNTGATFGVAVDKSNNLWVSDGGYNRVLRFKSPVTTGKAADIVIGQADFLTNTCATTAATLCSPRGIDFDSSDVLYVADGQNHRVLVFKSLKKGASASFELGHPAGAAAFTSNLPNDGGISARTLNGPSGLGLDSKKRIWVADTQNSRIVRFDPTLHNGDPAKLVLGQVDYGQNFVNQNLGFPSASSLSLAQGVYVRNSGDVWIGDSSNNRTLRFMSTFKNGMNSIMVLGQPDFTHNQADQGNVDPSDQTQNAPFEAGPSLIALAVLGGLAGGQQWLRRFRKKA